MTLLSRINPVHCKRRYRLYSPTAMTNAYQMVKDMKMSVKKASKVFRVPDTTLRDRVLQKVDVETAVFGKTPVLSCFEEANLVKHFKAMAAFGYGYTRQECVNIATDFAVHLGKRSSDKPFTMKWMRGFLKRRPELKVMKPRGLEHARAKMASQQTVSSYFENLRHTLFTHQLYDKPHLIYNIDEKGITIDHKPPSVVSDSSYCPQAVTSGRGKTITVLGGGSASGVAIPPFFIFPGKRMRPDLMNGASAGATGTVSETGWSNGVIFRNYLEDHFLKFVPEHHGQRILLLLDGHRSHVSVGLTEWAKQKDIIIFILPAHTSHILQPMDVSCYGPLEKIYNSKCHKLMRVTSAAITRYNICQVACKVYTKALSAENIQSGFRHTGIYPLDAEAIPCKFLIPAEVFRGTDSGGNSAVEGKEPGTQSLVSSDDSESFVLKLKEKETHLKDVKSGNVTKERKTMSMIVAGREISETIQNMMISHENNQKKTTKKSNPINTSTQKKCLNKTTIVPLHCNDNQLPGPSAINLVSDDGISDSDVEELDPSELCCVCKQFQPEELRQCVSLVFVKWAQCDSCNHWVHLIYCSPVRAIRRNDTFFCPHCRY